MGFSYNVNVLNQKGSPALYTDTFANRPNFGYAGRLFIANDTSAIYEDTGTAWVLIANVSSGAGTLQQVTTNGNTSNVGISITAGGLSTNSLTDTALTLGSVLFSGAAGLVTQDNAAFYWDDTNNRLGLNTVTPGNTLDVHFAGTASTIGLNNTAGNAATIVFANTGVNKWRIGNTAGNTFDIINVFTATSAISVNIAGNVVTLIGALNGTSSVFSSTITSQTNGSTFGNSAISGNPLIIKANAVSRAMQLLNTLGGAGEITITGSATTSNIGFNTVGQSDAFVVYNDGSNRSNGDVGMWGATTRNLNFFDSTNNNINAQIQYSEVNSNTGKLLFKTNNAGTSATRLTILESGDIQYTGQSTTVNAQAYIENTNTNLTFYASSSGSVNKNLRFFYNGSTGEAMRITSVGNILINSTTDDTVNKLQVTGSGKFTGDFTLANPSANTKLFINRANSTYSDGIFYQTNGTYDFVVGQNPLATGTSDYSIYNYGTSSVVFNIARSTGAATFSSLAGTGSRAVLADASGVLSAPVSDKLVKQNIEALKYGLNTIMQLNAVQFEFIDGYKNYGEGIQIGAIAQEVEQIIPEAVFTTPSTGLKGIDYNQLNGIYIKAIQDQQKIIESLIKRIELLENK